MPVPDADSCPIRLAVEGHYSRMLSPFESAEMTPGKRAGI